MFCSSQCLIRAFKSYLVFESKLDLRRMFPQTDLLPTQYLLPVRLLLLHPDTETKDHTETQDHSYGFGFSVDNIDPLTSLGSLLTHEDRLTGRERLEVAVTSLVLAECVREAGAELSVLQLARLVLRVRCNAHQVDQVTAITRGAVELGGLASAVYPVLPLLNHSCDPNTIRVYTGGRAVLVAAR